MAKQCIWLMENFEEARKMGENARKFAEENFDSKKINKDICEIIGVV